jgi:hypothetical protein
MCFMMLIFNNNVSAQPIPISLINQDTCIIVSNPFTRDTRAGTRICYRKNQIIFLRTKGSENPNFPPEAHKISTCPCQESIEVWEGPFGLIPEGAEVKDRNGRPIGYSFKNILVDDLRSSLVKSNAPKIENKFPQPISPTKEIKIVIVDTGVEFDSSIIKNHLTKMVSPNKICDKPDTKEGTFGMNNIDLLSIPNYYEPKDKDGHGTFINSILAGMAKDLKGNSIQNDPLNIALKQINVKFAESRTKNCYLFDGLCGIHYGINKGAKIINVSWRANSDTSIYKLFKSVLESLYANDVLLVCGAGNDEKDLNLKLKSWPAVLSDSTISGKYSGNVITVGAWNIVNNKISKFSDFGESTVNIYAPGESIVSIGFYNNKFLNPVIGQGTSYAAPFISRIAGILRGKYEDLTAAQTKGMIIKNAILKPSFTVGTIHPRTLYNANVLDYNKKINLYIK